MGGQGIRRILGEVRVRDGRIDGVLKEGIKRVKEGWEIAEFW